MKLVIIGGTGLIGSKLVNRLRERGHEAVPAALDTGVNTLTGDGLVETLQGASVVVDVSNSPSFEETASSASPMKLLTERRFGCQRYSFNPWRLTTSPRRSAG